MLYTSLGSGPFGPGRGFLLEWCYAALLSRSGTRPVALVLLVSQTRREREVPFRKRASLCMWRRMASRSSPVSGRWQTSSRIRTSVSRARRYPPNGGYRRAVQRSWRSVAMTTLSAGMFHGGRAPSGMPTGSAGRGRPRRGGDCGSGPLSRCCRGCSRWSVRCLRGTCREGVRGSPP